MIKEIKNEIEQAEEYLKAAGTTYEEVLGQADTEEYGVQAENNNYEAGRISAFKQVLQILDELGFKEEQED